MPDTVPVYVRACTRAFFCHLTCARRTDVRDGRRLCDVHIRTCTRVHMYEQHLLAIKSSF